MAGPPDSGSSLSTPLHCRFFRPVDHISKLLATCTLRACEALKQIPTPYDDAIKEVISQGTKAEWDNFADSVRRDLKVVGTLSMDVLTIISFSSGSPIVATSPAVFYLGFVAAVCSISALLLWSVITVHFNYISRRKGETLWASGVETIRRSMGVNIAHVFAAPVMWFYCSVIFATSSLTALLWAHSTSQPTQLTPSDDHPPMPTDGAIWKMFITTMILAIITSNVFVSLALYRLGRCFPTVDEEARSTSTHENDGQPHGTLPIMPSGRVCGGGTSPCPRQSRHSQTAVIR
ncbi:hypothetical protein NLI96_g5910 [Meripilus lineatus]|uniref:Transmembrane protein n=1 Tax=Meripilus lineatus TaxID=2056292 RepID=A0AAD5V3Y8_9APHY|nr:hypothetical protein NLI96_g5910 [Physisporinus lineatus]